MAGDSGLLSDDDLIGLSSPDDSEPIGIRQNNPGNIRATDTPWQGKTGGGGAFESFDTPENGVRALVKNARTQGKKNGNTIKGIMSAWSPPNENDTGSVIKNVSATMGLPPDEPILTSDPKTMAALAHGVITNENGKDPYSQAQLDQGALSALQEQPQLSPEPEPSGALLSDADLMGAVPAPASPRKERSTREVPMVLPHAGDYTNLADGSYYILPDGRIFQKGTAPGGKDAFMGSRGGQNPTLPQSSALGAFARGAERGALPAAAGVAAFPVGAAAGAGLGALTGPLAPVASPVLGLAGGLATSVLGAGAVSRAQEAVIERLPDSVKRLLGLDAEQAQADQAAHPYAQFGGNLAPNLLFFRPGKIAAEIPEGASILQRLLGNKITQRAVPAAINAGTEIGTETAQGEPLDPTKIAIQAGLGALSNRQTVLGRGLMAPGERLSSAIAGKITDLARPATEPERVEPTFDAAPPSGEAPVAGGPPAAAAAPEPEPAPVPAAQEPIPTATKAEPVMDPITFAQTGWQLPDGTVVGLDDPRARAAGRKPTVPPEVENPPLQSESTTSTETASNIEQTAEGAAKIGVDQAKAALASNIDPATGRKPKGNRALREFRARMTNIAKAPEPEAAVPAEKRSPEGQHVRRETKVPYEPPPLQPHEGSWAIINKETGEAVTEMHRGDDRIAHLNTAKYEAVPIGKYLAGLNKPREEPAAAATSAPEPETDRARAFVQQAREPGPKVETIFDAIRRHGGINDSGPEGGDLRQIMNGYRNPPFKKRILSKTGLPPDQMRAALQEEGWFGRSDDGGLAQETGSHPGDDIGDLYDAMDRQARGSDVYHPTSGDDEAVSSRAMMDEVLGRAGVGAADSEEVAVQKVAQFLRENGDSHLTEQQGKVDADLAGLSDEDRGIIEEHGYEPGADIGAELEEGGGAAEGGERSQAVAGRQGESRRGAEAPERDQRDDADDIPFFSRRRGGEDDPRQLGIFGTERSAQQLADAREAEGRGRLKSRTDQKEANEGLFAPKLEETDDLFNKPNFARRRGDEKPSLIVQHNLSANKLLHADRMGGLAAPSLAITKAEHPNTDFGEITLLGHKDMADPRGASRAKVFGSDVYSPRYPEISYKMDVAAIKRMADILKPFHEEADGKLRFPYGTFRPDELRGIPAFERWARAEQGEQYPDFNKAGHDLLQKVGAEEKMFKGHTYSGTARYEAHTLENVVKRLKKELRGGENFNYGVGSLRAKYTPQFRSVEAIRAAKGRLVTEEKFDSLKKEIDDKFWALAEKLKPSYSYDGNSFGFGDTVVNVLGDAAKQGLPRALREYGFKDVPDDVLRETRDYLESLRHLPTEYFETKILRGVGIPEFHTAVIPHDAPKNVRDVLEKRGVKTVEYKRNDKADRQRAIREAAEQDQENLMFSIRREGRAEKPFYSALTRTIEEMKQERAPAQQWAAVIDNARSKGVKQEEIDWSGVKDWLAEQKGPVSKADLLAHLRENEVQIEEVQHQDYPARENVRPDQEAQDEYRADWEAISEQIREKREQKESGRGPVSPADLQREIERLEDARDELHDQMVSDTLDRLKESRGITRLTKAPKYAGYKLPGGENYRELLLTMPVKEPVGETEMLRKIQAARDANDMVEANRLAAEYSRMRHDNPDAPLYKSSHWDEPNILAHIRFDDRTGPNGEKILHMAEVQSDWHQAGRRKGYDNKPIKPTDPMVAEQIQPGWMEVSTRDGRFITNVTDPHLQTPELAIEEARRRLRTEPQRTHLSDKVPDAPFKTSWHELAMKRMLRYAAEHGYDRVSWDTGETNAARYDLSKQIDHITVHPERGRGGKIVYDLTADDKNGNQVIHKTLNSPEEAVDIVGKEAADKLFTGENKERLDAGTHAVLSNADLKVGGEGMKGFYDKILPSFMNKYGKKFGAQASLRQKSSSGEIGADVGGVREIAGSPANSMDRAVIAAAQNDKVLKAIVSRIPADVVDILSANGLRPQDVIRDPAMLASDLPVNLHNSVSLGVRDALAEVGTRLGTGLRSAYEAGLDREILPALKASDIGTDVAARIIRASSGQGAGGGDAGVGAREAYSGTESRRGAPGPRGAEFGPAELTGFADWHSDLRPQESIPAARWEVPVTDAMREGVMQGQPMFKMGTRVLGKGEESATLRWTDEFNAEREAINADLRKRLDDIGLKGVKLEIPNEIDTPTGPVDGLSMGRLVAVAMNAAETHMGTLNHEAIHAMRRVGLFDDATWKVLTQRAKEWRKRFDIDKRYGDLGEDRLNEEAVAHAFTDYLNGKLAAGNIVKRAFNTAKKFFDAIRNVLAGRGFKTYRDVFSDIDQGAFKERGEAQAPADRMNFAKRRKEAEEKEERKPEGPINRLLGERTERIAAAVNRAAGKVVPDSLKDARDAVKMWASPMTMGSTEARAAAKDFANNMRLARTVAGRQQEYLKNKYSPADLEKMWRAADQESVILQQGGKPKEGEGLSSLTPEQRADVKAYQAESNAVLDQARDVGLFEGEGLPSYVPRMVVTMGEDGTYGRLDSANGDGAPPLDAIGRNLKTTSPNLRQRKYLTTEETEEAAQAIDPKAVVVKDIRTLAISTARLREAVAGRTLINQIKEVGRDSGTETVSEGYQPTEEETGHKWFTIDHPAFKTYRPRFRENRKTGKWEIVKDSDGNAVMEKVPLYIRGDFEGPLRAVLSKSPGKIYKAFMDLKGKTMSVIMYSPMMHNAVIWGKALPAAPKQLLNPLWKDADGKWHFSLELYGRGHAAKKDPNTMREAIKAGLDPIGHRFFNQDITGILEQDSLKPGRSWTSQIVGAIPGMFDKRAGDSVKRAIDKMGDVWHNTFLWDRVGDLQFGLYVQLRDKAIKEGADPQSAQRYAAHFANRYAGALPMESMSKMARQIANFALFSRSFTFTNLGAFKDLTHGLPKDVQSQILRDQGVEALNRIQGTARRKAAALLMMDMALSKFGNWMAAYALAYYLGRQFQAPEENEPEKKDRFLMGYDRDGTAVYGRLPTGKVGEDLMAWVKEPLGIGERKLSPYAHTIVGLWNNDRTGFGDKIYDPRGKDDLAKYVKNIGRIAEYIAESASPMSAFRGIDDLLNKRGDPHTNMLKTLLPLAGITVSQGAKGGPALGQLYDAREEHEFEVGQEMPEIKDKIGAGDVEGAIRDMTRLGLPRSMQQYIIRSVKNPGSRLNRRQMREFLGYATEEQKQKMQGFQKEQQERRAPKDKQSALEPGDLGGLKGALSDGTLEKYAASGSTWTRQDAIAAAEAAGLPATAAALRESRDPIRSHLRSMG